MDNTITALKEILSFIEAYSEYHIDDEHFEPGMTDAQMLHKNIPFLRDAIQHISRHDDSCTYEELRKAKSSVPPLFKYAVVSSGLDGDCFLTDDYEKALSKTKLMSILNRKMYYMLSINKIHDGTYKTNILFIYNDGKSVGDNLYDRDFLHFNYLLETRGLKMVKI